jgi:hypothetical protein
MQFEIVRQQLLRHEFQARPRGREIPNATLNGALPAIEDDPSTLEDRSPRITSSGVVSFLAH